MISRIGRTESLPSLLSTIGRSEFKQEQLNNLIFRNLNNGVIVCDKQRKEKKVEDGPRGKRFPFKALSYHHNQAEKWPSSGGKKLTSSFQTLVPCLVSSMKSLLLVLKKVQPRLQQTVQEFRIIQHNYQKLMVPAGNFAICKKGCEIKHPCIKFLKALRSPLITEISLKMPA